MKRLLLISLLFISSVAFATVNNQSVSVTYSCSGSTGPYSFTFPISDTSALTVTQDGVVLATSAYSVVPVNNNYANGGSVTLNVACNSPSTLILKRVTPVTQTTVYTDNMPTPMKTFEKSLDKLTEISIEQKTNLNSVGNWTCPAGQIGIGFSSFSPLCGTAAPGTYTWESPGTIGSVTPNTGAFTTTNETLDQAITFRVGAGGYTSILGAATSCGNPPLGPDVPVYAQGPADVVIWNKPYSTTSSTAVNSTGVHDITVPSTASFFTNTPSGSCTGTTLTINRYQADVEGLTAGSAADCATLTPPSGEWCIKDSATITANFTKTHASTPYTVSQAGAAWFRAYTMGQTAQDGTALWFSQQDAPSAPYYFHWSLPTGAHLMDYAASGKTWFGDNFLNATNIGLLTTATQPVLQAAVSGTAFIRDTAATPFATFTATTATMSNNLVVTGKVTSYSGVATDGIGVPAVRAHYTQADLTAAVGSTTLYAPTADGFYLISWSANVKTAGSVSSTLGGTNGLQITYTEADDSVSKTTVAPVITSAGNTTATAIGGSQMIHAKASTNITFTFDYTANAANSMHYNLDVVCIRVY